MPGVISGYKQDQTCPVCMALQDNVEEEVGFLEGTRNPKQWYDHLRVAHRAGDLCMCSHTLGTLQQNILHLAIEHDIYTSVLGLNLASAQIFTDRMLGYTHE